MSEKSQTVYVVSHIGNYIFYYTRDLDASEKAAKKYKANITSYSSLDAALKNEPFLQPLPDND